MKPMNVQISRTLCAAICVGMLSGCGVAHAASAAAAVDAGVQTPQRYRLFSQTVPLIWDWNWEWVPQDATQVMLTIAGSRSPITQTFAKPATNYLWTVFSDPSTFKEDVYQVTLSFRDAGGDVLAVRSVRLEALAGAFSRATVKVFPTEHGKWRSMRDGDLIPYDAQWLSSTADAESATLVWTHAGETYRTETYANSSVGSSAWSSVGCPYGEYRVDLIFDGAAAASWTAYVNVFATGSVVVVR